MARNKLPQERTSITRKFNIPSKGTKKPCATCGHYEEDLRIYAILGLYPDGSPGELFLHTSDKVGQTIHGFAEALAIAVSLGLQHGVPLQTFIEKLRGMRFEPAGFTGDEKFPRCTSVVDLLAQWWAQLYPPADPAAVANEPEKVSESPAEPVKAPKRGRTKA